MFDIRKCRSVFFITHFDLVSGVLFIMMIFVPRAGAGDDGAELTPEQAAAYERLRGKFSL